MLLCCEAVRIQRCVSADSVRICHTSPVDKRATNWAVVISDWWRGSPQVLFHFCVSVCVS